MPSQIRAISFENEIIVAMKALEVYLIISAVRGVVWMIGVFRNIAYISASCAVLRASMPPTTIRSGSWKSFTATPSARNSGFMPKPKSLPATRPEASSMALRTTVSVVPGTTVLLTVTTQ